MCTIADISEGGAGLTVVSTKAIPETFELQIKGEETRRACRVAWRKEPHKLGVQFVMEPSAVVADSAVNPAAAR
jgi:hypothetical protein